MMACRHDTPWLAVGDTVILLTLGMLRRLCLHSIPVQSAVSNELM